MDGAKWLASVLCSTEIENPMYELWASRCLSIRDLMTSQKEIESWWNVTTLSSQTVWTDAKKTISWKRLLLALSALFEFSNPSSFSRSFLVGSYTCYTHVHGTCFEKQRKIFLKGKENVESMVQLWIHLLCTVRSSISHTSMLHRIAWT